jgi:hypothetical protein
MTPFDALKNAKHFISMAEEAKDELNRRRYEDLAREWLAKVYLKGWQHLSPYPKPSSDRLAVLHARSASGWSPSQQSDKPFRIH